MHYLDEPCQRHFAVCAVCGAKHWDDGPCPRIVSDGVRIEDGQPCDICMRNGDESPKTVLRFSTVDCCENICMEHLRQVIEKVAQGVVGEFFPRKDGGE